MTLQEFKAWKAETAKSRGRWLLDPVNCGERGRDMLFYRGGESGKFVSIDAAGGVRLGDYDGAVPHIGEAFFVVKAEKRYANRDEAIARMVEAGGLQLLGALVGVELG